MARSPKGSTPKLTDELIEEISLLLRRGNYIETAVAACGISKDTFYRWLKDGKNDRSDSLQKKLSDAVMKSLAEAEVRDLEVIDKAAFGSPDIFAKDDEGNPLVDSSGNPIIEEYGLPPNWRVSAWRLERRFPDRWGKKTTLELDEINNTGIEITFVDPHIESK